jgi:glycosyltransferase involved in cell wall biosynthesis
VIHNGLDPQPYLSPPQLDLRKELHLPAGAALIGFVGQLDERKGFQWLLPAFARIGAQNRDSHLVLVGEGPLRESIIRFAQEHDLQKQIHLLGFRDDIHEIMKNLALLVLPSLWEGFGIVLLEAMASAKPVVTTHISSMPEIVKDGITGRVVPAKSSEALYEAFNEILGNELLARTWGENGRQRLLEHFTLDYMVDQYIALFHKQLDAVHSR